MDEDCELCQFLQNPTFRVITGKYWTFGLGNNQAYLGRGYITLLRHVSSLAELNVNDWYEFSCLINELEGAYQMLFSANPLNYACLMNHAYRVVPAHPHVHWHVYPRYKKPKTIAGHTFVDPDYGNMYNHTRQQIVPDDVVQHIADQLANKLQGCL